MTQQRKVELVVDVVPGKTTGANAIDPTVAKAKNAQAELDKLKASAGGAGAAGGKGVLGVLPAGDAGAGAAAGGGLGGVAGGLTSLTSALGPYGVAAGVAIAATTALGMAAVNLAGKASPQTMERFTMAIDDAQAVVGRVFVPLLEIATDNVRSFGDMLATILPSAADVREALAPVREALASLRESAAPIGPILRGVLIEMLTRLGFALKLAAEAAKPFLLLLSAFSSLAGGTKLSSSYGAAGGGQASFIGLSELGQQAQLSAFGSGGNAMLTTQEQVAANTAKCADFLGQLVGAASKTKQAVGVAADVGGTMVNPLGLALNAGRAALASW